jgi:hypothetical protein
MPGEEPVPRGAGSARKRMHCQEGARAGGGASSRGRSVGSKGDSAKEEASTWGIEIVPGKEPVPGGEEPMLEKVLMDTGEEPLTGGGGRSQ